jgi:CRP-like cAMP-binding protein
MQTEPLHSVLASCPLFRGVSPDTVAALLGDGTAVVRTFRPGEEIPITYGGERALVVLTGGQALAYSTDEKRDVILRAIQPGTAFGVSVLFSDEEPVSIIRAKTRSEALCFPAPTVRMLLEHSDTFRMNYITFLSGRIRFLNRRIACYTAGSAERKLALYLSELTSDTSANAMLDLSMTELSELLDIGRASLYRAFTRLTELGLIERNDRRIHVPNRRALLTYVEKNETV